MSEAGPGNTDKLLARHQHFTIALAVVAAALWAFAIAAAAAVVADRLPDLIAGTILALAGTATVLAGVLAAGHLRQRIMLEVAAADRAALCELVGASVREQMNDTLDLTPLVIGMARITDRVREQSEQVRELAIKVDDISKKGGDFWQGYTAGVDDLNGDGVTSLDAKRRAPN